MHVMFFKYIKTQMLESNIIKMQEEKIIKSTFYWWIKNVKQIQ